MSSAQPGGATSAAESPTFVSSASAQQLLSWSEIIDCVRAAYEAPLIEANAPPRVVARGKGVWLRSLIAVPPHGRHMGGKIFGRGRSGGVSYLIVLFDQETGEIDGFVDGNLVTAMRTAGTSAVAVDRLAPPGPVRLGVLGSGLEARQHVEAIACVRQIESLKVFSPTAANRAALAERASTRLGIPGVPVASAREAVEDATLVLAAARSYDEAPILEGAWLRPDTTIVSIGSTLPEQREVATDVIEACDLIVCDALEEVVHETGDMIAATSAGTSFAHKLMSLQDALAEAADARIRAAPRRMFKSVGSGLQDVAVATLVLEKARARGLAQPLGVEFLKKAT